MTNGRFFTHPIALLRLFFCFLLGRYRLHRPYPLYNFVLFFCWNAYVFDWFSSMRAHDNILSSDNFRMRNVKTPQTKLNAMKSSVQREVKAHIEFMCKKTLSNDLLNERIKYLATEIDFHNLNVHLMSFVEFIWHFHLMKIIINHNRFVLPNWAYEWLNDIKIFSTNYKLKIWKKKTQRICSDQTLNFRRHRPRPSKIGCKPLCIPQLFHRWFVSPFRHRIYANWNEKIHCLNVHKWNCFPIWPFVSLTHFLKYFCR